MNYVFHKTSLSLDFLVAVLLLDDSSLLLGHIALLVNVLFLVVGVNPHGIASAYSARAVNV